MNDLHLPVFSFASSIIVITEIQRFGKGYNKPTVCEMIFDTGATMTAIDENIATRLGYKWQDGEDATVAGIGNAALPAKIITVPSLILDGYDIGPNSLHVIKFPEDANTKAVLGMNVIRNFKTLINIKTREDESYDVTKPIGMITLTPKFALNDKPRLEDFIPKVHRFGVWNVNYK
jgi:hypothetical protein